MIKLSLGSCVDKEGEQDTRPTTRQRALRLAHDSITVSSSTNAPEVRRARARAGGEDTHTHTHTRGTAGSQHVTSWPALSCPHSTLH